MPAEAAFRVTVKDASNNLYTLGGDSYAEFVDNLTALLGNGDAERFLNGYRAAFGGTPTATLAAVPDMAQAEENVVRAFSQPAPVAVPQPQPVATAPAVPACAHGPRVFRSSQTTRGQWDRYECALPWKPNSAFGAAEHNAARCKNVNA